MPRGREREIERAHGRPAPLSPATARLDRRPGRTPDHTAPVTRYVLDAPTLVRLVSDGIEVSPEHQLVAPARIRSEALALLFEAVRCGDLTEKAALEQHERLTELKMRLLGDRMSRGTAWRIARDQGWGSTRDAEYLAVTKLQADALVTIDPALAATAAGIVPLAPFAALSMPSPGRGGVNSGTAKGS